MNHRAFAVFLTAALSLLSSSSQAQEPVVVQLDTSEGKIVLQLDAEKAPKTVENFVNYVKKGHYAGTIFHRVIPDFMIQGGGLDAELNEKDTDPPVKNEAGNGLKNTKYTVAMARTSAPHSATSQFFINTASNSFLNREEARDGFGYTVFGKVIEGFDVVDKIGKTQTAPRRNPQVPQMLMRDVPVNPIVIESAKLVEKN